MDNTPRVDESVVLGLDLGTASVGWALLKTNANGDVCGIVRAGVRIFDAGSEGLGKGKEKEKSNASARRQVRLQRRQFRRRGNRLARLYRELSDAKLLPALSLPTFSESDYRTRSEFKRAREDAERRARHEELKRLDRELWQALQNAGHISNEAYAWLPYILRAAALERKLEPFELGRAIFHLAQKRGFRGSRIANDAEEADAAALELSEPTTPPRRKKAPKSGGKLAPSLSRYKDLVNDNQARTIGEAYLSILRGAKPSHERTPGEGTLKRKGEAAWRTMYEDEFWAIWNQQRRFDPSLDALELVRQARRSRRAGGGIIKHVQPVGEVLYRTIFFQRPLKSAAGLVGTCEVENGSTMRLDQSTGELTPTKTARRLPWAHPLAQEYRSLAMVNNTKVMRDGSEFPLEPGQRATLLKRLSEVDELTFAAARELLNLAGTKFNFERHDSASEKKFRGAKTLCAFREAFGSRFQQIDVEALFHDWYSIADPRALEFRLATHWRMGLRSAERAGDLAPDQVMEECIRLHVEAKRSGKRFGRAEAEAKFGRIQVSPAARNLARAPYATSYCALSRTALERILPAMRAGVTEGNAKQDAYIHPKGEMLRKLPPVSEVFPLLNSPVVKRTLSEMRKVVNAIVAEHGLPGKVRIEMARDLKATPSERAAIIARQNLNREARKNARALAKALGLVNKNSGEPSDKDVLRVQLAQECGWRCPYSGLSFDGEKLRSGEVDIEHIIPRSMRPDDSFANLTLAYSRANAAKAGMPPHAAFAHNPPGYNWRDILDNVRAFRRTEDYSEATSRLAAPPRIALDEEETPREAKKKKSKAAQAREGEGSSPKLRLFLLQGDRSNPSAELKAHCERFTNADLTQTGWATRYAAQFLGLLYGLPRERPHEAAGGKRRVYASTGQSTSDLRKWLGKAEGSKWLNLNTILDDTRELAVPGKVADPKEWGKKTRADHRHHAIDAVVVALTTPEAVQRIASLYIGKRFMSPEDWFDFRRKLASTLLPSWPTVYDELKSALYGDGKRQELLVSHRVSKKVRGSLHQATITNPGEGKIRVAENTVRDRTYESAPIHHMVIVRAGKKFRGENVNILTVAQRKARNKGVSAIQTASDDDFVLFPGDVIRLTSQVRGTDRTDLYVVSGFEGQSNVTLYPHWLGIPKDRKHPLAVRRAIDKVLTELRGERLSISILGALSSPHD